MVEVYFILNQGKSLLRFLLGAVDLGIELRKIFDTEVNDLASF